MELVWYRHDREAIVAGLQRGERPDLATTMACGPRPLHGYWQTLSRELR